MHPLKLCSNLQHSPILGLRDVEPHKEPTAGAEKQEYEKTKMIQMLLERKHFGGHLYVSVSDAFNLISTEQSLLCVYWSIVNIGQI